MTIPVIKHAAFQAAMGLVFVANAAAAEPPRSQALPGEKPGMSRAEMVQATLDELKANPAAMSAIRLVRGNGPLFCTTGTKVDRTIYVDNDRTAVMYTPEFRAWHGRGNAIQYSDVRDNARELVVAMLASKCQIIVESAPNIVAIAKALEQEGMLFTILPSPLLPAQLAEAFAASLGFTSHAELMLAAHMMANHEELQTYFRFGIKSAPDYDEALERMQSQGYSQDRLQLLTFLADEAEGTRRNLSAAAVREERHARALAPSQ